MRLVEEHRLPRPPKDFVIGRRAEPVLQHAQLFGRGEQSFEFPRALLQFDPAAVDALENRIQFAADDRPIGALGHEVLEIGGHGQPQLERRVRLAIELLDQRRHGVPRAR